jgi:cellulose synthase/poly-beta-1,6-N-acetylglucosamine synthase-like glycosyltransferase
LLYHILLAELQDWIVLSCFCNFLWLCSFHVRVLVPCYNEPLAIVKDTLKHALDAKLPVGVRREVYLCDDGNDKDKRKLVEEEFRSKGCHYVTGRKRKEGELNGKSCNVNNCLKNYIYSRYLERGESIPQNEVVVIFDADMCAKPAFFVKVSMPGPGHERRDRQTSHGSRDVLEGAFLDGMQ